MAKITKIAIGGGPCGGKTLILLRLQSDRDISRESVFCPEMAQMFLDKNFPRSTPGSIFYERQLHLFQRAVASSQIVFEQAMINLAMEKGKRLVTCDRGVLDGAAYVGSIEKLCELCGLDAQKILASYDCVIHMETLAIAEPEIYRQSGRSESVEEAIRLDKEIKRAWQYHPNRLIIPSHLSTDEKFDRVKEKILQVLSASCKKS